MNCFAARQGLLIARCSSGVVQFMYYLVLCSVVALLECIPHLNFLAHQDLPAKIGTAVN